MVAPGVFLIIVWGIEWPYEISSCHIIYQRPYAVHTNNLKHNIYKYTNSYIKIRFFSKIWSGLGELSLIASSRYPTKMHFAMPSMVFCCFDASCKCRKVCAMCFRFSPSWRERWNCPLPTGSTKTTCGWYSTGKMGFHL